MLAWPLTRKRQTHFADWALFNAPRTYRGRPAKHEGLDFHVIVGDDVIACLGGRVVWASDQRRHRGGDSLYGKHIIIEHRDGLITTYAHLDEMLVVMGDLVDMGELIGYAGRSGKATGPHLHLTVQHIGHGLTGYVLNDVVDPLKYLKRINGAT